MSGQVQSSFGLLGEGALSNGKIFWTLGSQLDSQGLQNPLPPTTKARQHLFVIKKKNRRSRKVENPLASLLRSHNGNDTEPANGPVDAATEQNQTGPSGQVIDEFWPLWKFVSG